MKLETIEFIKELTKNDSKTLTGKGLKACEEAGELAKKCLPRDGNSGTLHRFVTDESILEEVADLMLVAMSIAYSLGFDDNDIEQMMLKKASYWQALQQREKKTRSKMAYEIHVTVDEVKDIDRFKNFCTMQLGVKPIVIALQDQDQKEIGVQAMTSSTLATDDSGARYHMNAVAERLEMAGYKVVRKKIECPGFHPAAPMRDSGVSEMPKGCYFESHFNVIVQGQTKEEVEQRLKSLQGLAMLCDAHFSKNAFKQYDELHSTRMLTYRSYKGTYEDFLAKIQRIKLLLAEKNFEFEKEIVEFSLYDSQVGLDGEWAAQT